MGASGRLADTVKTGKEGVQDAAYRYRYRARGGASGEARAARALVENGGARARAEEHARRYVAEADGLLDALGLRADERAVFAAVARYLIERAG